MHSLSTYFQMKNLDADPTVPPQAGEVRIYAKDSKLYLQDEDDDVREIGTVGSVTGTGTATRLAFWSGSSVITSDADLTFVTDTLFATKIVAPTSLSIGVGTAFAAPLYVKAAATLVARFDGSAAGAQVNIDIAQGGNTRWIAYLNASATPQFALFNVRRSADAFVLTDLGSTIVGDQAAVATNATDGFLYVPSCAGVPTGTPTGFTGKIAVVADSTNNKLYIYSGGAWQALN